MLVSLDDSVGKILQQLHASHLDRKTLVIFLSDNGGPTRELTSSNLPLRGGKGTMYEGGLRVPFLMRWTDTLKSHQTFDRPVSSMDLFSTSAVLAGAAVPQNIDGRDLMPYLLNEKAGSPHKEFFWRQGSRAALRQGDWKIVNMRGKQRQPEWELYHIAHDLTEEHNLAAQQKEKLNELKTRWRELNALMKPSLF